MVVLETVKGEELVMMVLVVMVVVGSDGSHDDGGWVWCYGSKMMVGVDSDGECMVVQVWVVVVVI